jgi:hypothetical protein
MHARHIGGSRRELEQYELLIVIGAKLPVAMFGYQLRNLNEKTVNCLWFAMTQYVLDVRGYDCRFTAERYIGRYHGSGLG